MTLRLDYPTETQLESLAYDLRLSKAGTVRRCIHQAIADMQRRHSSARKSKFEGGAE
jgi:hypothetical protein